MVSHTKYINNFYAKYLLALILASVLLFIANENLLAWILGAVCAFILDFHHFIIAIIIGGLISKNKPLL